MLSLGYRIIQRFIHRPTLHWDCGTHWDSVLFPVILRVTDRFLTIHLERFHVNSSIIVRSANASDLGVLVEGNSMMADESEGKQLDQTILTRGVQRALDDPMRGRYLVAECEDRLIGQLMVTQEWSDWRDGWFWWIQSVYVARDFRRKGVYRQLYEYLRDEAKRTNDVCGLRLYVERENTPAIATYESLGMVDAGYNLYEVVWPTA